MYDWRKNEKYNCLNLNVKVKIQENPNMQAAAM
jgi:hypothetical protein